MNRVIKDLQEWKEAPADVLLLSFFHLQAYYYNEIRRGMCGLGEYRWKTILAYLSKDAGEAEYMKCQSPDEIVKLLKDEEFSTRCDASPTLSISPSLVDSEPDNLSTHTDESTEGNG